MKVAGRSSQVAGVFLALFAFMAGAQPLRVPDAEQFVGAPKGTPLTGAALETKAHDIDSQLRCPVCQGLAIGDSPSEMAANMKGQVRELLSRGFTEQQILDYFERSYGQFVLLKPKFQGVNSLVWTLPLFVLILGVVIIVVKLRKLQWSAGAPPAQSDDEYVTRVRDLVEK